MKAMILSAGYGTRLGSLTHQMPKPMLLLQNRPLLEYIICNLAKHGFNQIVINLHFMPDLIQNYFGDGSHWGVELTYSYEAELLGTAGGVKKMESFFAAEELFLIHYGDIITDQSFTDMLHFHRDRKALATLLLHQRARSNSIVSLDEQKRIIGFLERPTDEARRGVQSPWVNSGICICNPQILANIPANKPYDLPRDVFANLIDSNHLYGYPLAGYRCAVDSPQRLAEADTAIADGVCHVQLPQINNCKSPQVNVQFGGK